MRPLKTLPSLKLEILKTAVFKSPTRLFCEDCGKYVPSTMPWVCPYCGTVHSDVRLHSFLYKCKGCQRRSEGVECPHCKTIWTFSSEGDVRFVAKRAPEALPVTKPSETEQEKRRREHSEKMENLRFEHEERKLAAEMKQYEERIAPRSANDYQKMAEEIMRGHSRLFALHEMASFFRKHWAEKHKDDPDLLNKLNIWLDSLQTDHTHRP